MPPVDHRRYKELLDAGWRAPDIGTILTLEGYGIPLALGAFDEEPVTNRTLAPGWALDLMHTFNPTHISGRSTFRWAVQKISYGYSLQRQNEIGTLAMSIYRLGGLKEFNRYIGEL